MSLVISPVMSHDVIANVSTQTNYYTGAQTHTLGCCTDEAK